jgi:hypothetical protein
VASDAVLVPPGQASARVVRWSVALLTAASVGSALYASTADLSDPDVFWVAAAGRESAIPRTNLFSFTDPQHIWVMHEWLFARPYAYLLGHWGAPAFGLVAALSFAVATFALAEYFVSQSTRLASPLLLLACTVGLVGYRFVTARPTALALTLAVVFASIALRPRLSLLGAIALVLLQLVWTNAHGSFVVGVGVTMLAVVLFPSEWRMRLPVALLTLTATVANPYGLRLHAFVFDYFAGQSDIYAVITKRMEDFQPMFVFPVTTIKLLWGLVALQLALGMGAMRQRPFRLRGAIALGLLVVELRNVRNIHIGGLIALMLLVPYVDRLLKRTPSTASVLRFQKLPALLGGVAVAAAVVGVAVRPATTSTEPRFSSRDGTPGRAWLEALGRVPDGAHLFVPFPAGGFAIWFGWPRRVRVFFDPRNDCYSAPVAETFLALDRGALPLADATAALVQAGTTHVLVPNKHPLMTELRASDAYRVILELPELTLFGLAGSST